MVGVITFGVKHGGYNFFGVGANAEFRVSVYIGVEGVGVGVGVNNYGVEGVWGLDVSTSK